MPIEKLTLFSKKQRYVGLQNLTEYLESLNRFQDTVSVVRRPSSGRVYAATAR